MHRLWAAPCQQAKRTLAGTVLPAAETRRRLLRAHDEFIPMKSQTHSCLSRDSCTLQLPFLKRREPVSKNPGVQPALKQRHPNLSVSFKLRADKFPYLFFVFKEETILVVAPHTHTLGWQEGSQTSVLKRSLG